MGDINVLDNWVFTYGKTVKEQTGKEYSVTVNKVGVELDFCITDAYDVPIVSESFVSSLSEFIDEVQLIPISITKAKLQHYILVITNKIDCINEKKSKYEKFIVNDNIRPDKAGEYKSIMELKIDSSKINLNIFRVAKYDIAIIVSEAIKNRMEKLTLSGIEFSLVT